MGVVSGWRSSHENSNDHSGNIPIEGTAARTRPFSFEEILLRRKSKKITADVEDGSGHANEHSEKSDLRGSAHLNSTYAHKLKNDVESTVERCPKEQKDAKRYVLSDRKEDHLKDKQKAKHELEASAKFRHYDDKRSNEKQSKSAPERHHRSKTGKQFQGEVEKEIPKKRPKDAISKDKVVEGDKRFKRENKRLYHDEIDAKVRSEFDRPNLKKRDSYRLQDSEYPDRKDQRYEERKSKRRRSRSREYNHARGRSISVSPRTQKRSHHGRSERDRGEQSSHSFKERSGRQYPELDKHRSSGNGGHESGYHRNRGSGLGGYSPRKRRTESAVRSPSPTICSPQRKVSTWDQPPGGSLSKVQSNITLRKNDVLSSNPNTTSVLIKSESTPLSKVAATSLDTSLDSIQLTQATRPKRRLYIENLPASASDKMVIEWLNDSLLSSGVIRNPGNSPCISCIINKEKSQAVVEFLTPEDATTVLSLDGKSFSGSILKIRRPKDFIDAATLTVEKTPDVTATVEKPPDVTEVKHDVSDVVTDSPHKIFVGGISKSLTSGMLMEVVSAFGTLKAYHFEESALSESCAFFEYLDPSISDKACVGLNGMKLGGQMLTVVKCFPDYHWEGSMEPSASYDIPNHAKPLLENPTQVVKLKNVFNVEEFSLLPEPELEETLEDIRIECARFGTIKSINIARHLSNDTTAVSAQNPNAASDATSEKTEANNEPSDTDSKPYGDTMPFNGPQDAEALEKPINDNDNSDNHVKEEICSLSLVDNEITNDGPLHLNAMKASPTADNMDSTVKVEEGGFGSESNLVREESETVKTEQGEQPAELNIFDTAEKLDVVEEDSKPQNCEIHMFEPGCVLVEFLREESACMAAHSLNGRCYDGRFVEASYVAHDIYLAHFH